MNTRKTIATIAMIASLFLVTGMTAAQADSTEPTQATADGSPVDQGQYAATGGSATVNSDAGNVYAANISGTESTVQWAGLYGNATGTLVLGDSANDRLYEWDASASYVFASSDTINFGSLTAGDTSALNTELSYGNDSDNASETYNETSTTYDSIASAPTANTYNGADSQVWSTALLDDGDTGLGQFVFTAEAQPLAGETAYDGSEADYQAIVPTGEDSTQSYNLYMELK